MVSSKNNLEKKLSDIKAVSSILILFVAFSVLLLFVRYQNSIVQNNNLTLFVVLSIVCMGFLLALLYLINPKKK